MANCRNVITVIQPNLTTFHAVWSVLSESYGYEGKTFQYIHVCSTLLLRVKEHPYDFLRRKSGTLKTRMDMIPKTI